MEDYISLKKRNILKIGIKDEDGKPKLDENGNEVYLTFDLEDITAADRYDRCIELNKKALSKLKGQIVIINKQQDEKGDGFLSKNEKAKAKALEEYYKETEKAMDLFLGKGGTQKIFGDIRYLTMFDDLTEMLKPILPKIEINAKSIEEQIKNKYKIDESNDVLKDE